MKKLTDVTVDKISLLTKDNAPAVPKAKFAILKMFKKKKVITKKINERLDKIISR